METQYSKTAHEDTAHEVTVHEETAHEDTAHEDRTHVDTTHEHIAHEDIAHEDTTHKDTAYKDTAHLDWFTSYLSFRTQSVLVGHASTPYALKCGVLQGSVLGPLLFTLYTQSLSTGICQSGHSYHFFADDSQLHN